MISAREGVAFWMGGCGSAQDRQGRGVSDLARAVLGNTTRGDDVMSTTVQSTTRAELLQRARDLQQSLGPAFSPYAEPVAHIATENDLFIRSLESAQATTLEGLKQEAQAKALAHGKISRIGDVAAVVGGTSLLGYMYVLQPLGSVPLMGASLAITLGCLAIGLYSLRHHQPMLDARKFASQLEGWEKHLSAAPPAGAGAPPVAISSPSSITPSPVPAATLAIS